MKRLLSLPEIQGFDAVSVAGKENHLPSLIDKAKSPHPVEAMQAIGAPLPVGGKDDFRIGMAAESMTQRG